MITLTLRNLRQNEVTFSSSPVRPLDVDSRLDKVLQWTVLFNVYEDFDVLLENSKDRRRRHHHHQHFLACTTKSA